MKFPNSKAKGGRPPFKPSKTHRRTVLIAIAAGLSETEAADVVGINRSTLREHFPEEIKFGRSRAYVENLLRLDRAAQRGSTSAMKFLAQAYASGSTPSLVGKKALAEDRAKTAATGTSWEDVLGPQTDLTDETLQ